MTACEVRPNLISQNICTGYRIARTYCHISTDNIVLHQLLTRKARSSLTHQLCTREHMYPSQKQNVSSFSESDSLQSHIQPSHLYKNSNSHFSPIGQSSRTSPYQSCHMSDRFLFISNHWPSLHNLTCTITTSLPQAVIYLHSFHSAPNTTSALLSSNLQHASQRKGIKVTRHLSSHPLHTRTKRTQKPATADPETPKSTVKKRKAEPLRPHPHPHQRRKSRRTRPSSKASYATTEPPCPST